MRFTPAGSLIAMRAADPNGPASEIVRFGPTSDDGNHGGTGVWVHDGYVYAETNDKIVRYKLPDHGIAPTGPAETVVSGLPLTGDHPMHPMAIDRTGDMFVDLGSATNACQGQNRIAGVPGTDPCTELETRAGIWRFDASKLNQAFSPAERFATGLRNSEAVSFDSQGRMFRRSSTGAIWLFQKPGSKLYNAKQKRRPAGGSAGGAAQGRRLRLAGMLL